ncbi:hypothetical protein [Paraburkholderia domus]|uniref:hypothetical protein n=1 Tax=Paraburkholderia domus TaxID=2793075 RepID=UPI001EF06266|nr:hypothetical protein [Paraburkholderia domus]
MLIVVQSERVDGADCVKVQLRNQREKHACLTVTITRGGEYVAGAHNGAAVDELGAVAALSLYQSEIRGQWERVFV